MEAAMIVSRFNPRIPRGSRKLLLLLLCALIPAGCGDSTTQPPAGASPCTIPAGHTGAELYLTSIAASVKVGDVFRVAVILHGVPDPFGVAFELMYPSARVHITGSSLCSESVFGKGNVIPLWQDEPASNQGSYAVTRERGSQSGSASDNVVCYFTCTATAAGTATFSFGGTLEVRKSDGSLVDEFASLQKTPLEVTITQ
jgi:hypothetical protein